MSKLKLKIGVLGAGNMGKNHIRVLSELSTIYDLVGFFEPRDKNAEEVEEKFNIKRYKNVEELIAMADAIDIVVPSSLHYDIAMKVAQSKKDCFVEKPLTLTSDDAIKLGKEFKKANKKLMVGHIERFNPTINELEKILANEEIVHIDIHRCSPYDGRINDADVVQDLMIHDIDILINALVDSEIVSLSALGTQVYNKENMDVVSALLRFENGITASIMASRVTEEKIRTVEIHTKNSYILVDLLNRKIQISRKTKFKLDIGFMPLYRQENIIEKIVVPAQEPLREELIHFANVIINNTQPKTSADDAIKAIQLTERIGEILYGK